MRPRVLSACDGSAQRRVAATAAELILALARGRPDLRLARLAGVFDPGETEGRRAVTFGVDLQGGVVLESQAVADLLCLVELVCHLFCDIRGAPVGGGISCLGLPVSGVLLGTKVTERAMDCPGLLACDECVGNIRRVVLIDVVDDVVATEEQPSVQLAPFSGPRGLASNGARLERRVDEISVCDDDLRDGQGRVVRGTSHGTSSFR